MTVPTASNPRLAPAARVLAAPAYTPSSRSRTAAAAPLRLNANECPSLPGSWCSAIELPLEALTRYPDAAPLQGRLADRLKLSSDQLVITAGADDALGRLCTALIEPGRNIILTRPTFEMLPIYTRLADGEAREVKWMDGPFPTDAIIAAADDDTSAIFVVSPNNPTGLVATANDLTRLRDAVPRAALILDAAYEEFADATLTAAALALPGTVVTRTFSKAYGLAGLRVGYAAGDPTIISWLRRVGQPYACSALSLELVSRWLDPLTESARVAASRVRLEREALRDALRSLGVHSLPSQGNFILARFADPAEAARVFAELASRGVLVREFSTRPELADRLRITCPADHVAFDRLQAALIEALNESRQP